MPREPRTPVQPNTAAESGRCEDCKQFVIYCRCYGLLTPEPEGNQS